MSDGAEIVKDDKSDTTTIVTKPTSEIPIKEQTPAKPKSIKTHIFI